MASASALAGQIAEGVSQQIAASANALKCPTPFVSTDANTCVMPCPADKSFVRQGTSGSFQCVYTPDDKYRVNLTSVGAVAFPGTSLDELRIANSTKYTEFSAEKDRFTNEFAVVYGNIDKKQMVDDAFRALQAAENTRAEAPEAYQVARTAYYTLVNGESWLEDERKRITRAEIDPEIQRYRDAVSIVKTQKEQQQKTYDVIQGVKDKVLSIRDDFKYSVDMLSDQVEKVKTQINMENRSRTKETEGFWAWLDTILNIVLLSLLIYAAWTLYRKYGVASPQPTYTVQT